MYLSRLQRQMIMYVGVKGGAVREFVDATDDLTPQEKWRLKTGHTHFEKAMTSYVSRLDPDVKERLRKELRTSTLQVVPDRGIPLVDSEKVVKEEDLYELGELVTTAYCQGPDGCMAKGKWRKCKAYQAMMHVGLAPANYEKGECPYKLL